MKTKRLLMAFGQLDEQYIEEAAPNMQKRKKRKRNRRAAAAAAVLLMFAGIFGTAMAVSAQFRQMVWFFFHLEQTERIPEPDENNSSITQSDISGLIEAEYIRLNGSNYGSGYGTLHQADYDENGAIRSVRFWTVKDGSAHALEVQKNSFSVKWQNQSYQGNIYWCTNQGQISLYDEDLSEPSNSIWHFMPIPGRTDAALLYLSQGRYDEYRQYPLLYHLDTGEMEDILQGTGVEDLASPSHYQWSDDLNKIVVLCRTTDKEQEFYYCDVPAKTLTSLNRSTGLEISNAFFADGHTLLLVQADKEKCSVFTYDTSSGQIKRTLEDEKLFENYGMRSSRSDGIMLFGGRYGLYADPAGSLSAVDLKTGIKTPVSGFTLEQGGDFLSNPSNTKLLYSVTNETADDSLGISSLGVLDLKTGIFTAFDREGYEKLYEWSLGWFDDDRVEVWSKASGTDVLYLYGF